LASCYAQLQGQAAQKLKEHETMIHLLENNVDHEIVELKTSYEKQLYEEREVNMHLRGQEFVTNKRFIRSVADNVVPGTVLQIMLCIVLCGR
jgi:hypothetical protein